MRQLSSLSDVDLSAKSLSDAETWNLTTRFGDLDLSFVSGGTRGYADLDADASDVELYGVVVRVASLADVVRSKQAANRPKDQRVLPTLRALLGKGVTSRSGRDPRAD